MKLASFRHEGRKRFGIVNGNGVVAVGGGENAPYPSLRHALDAGALDELAEIATAGEATVPLSDVKLLPLIPNPEKVLCIGINYGEHAKETGNAITASPSIFSRFTNTLVASGDPIVRPSASEHFDFEGELAVIIGKRGRYIPASQALDHVAGYSIFFDGSVRDFQKHSVTAGKNFPATAPFGPVMVTADEVPDPRQLTMTTRLNGDVVQYAGIDEMLRPVEELIAYLSTVTELVPGDVIATGTPSGVGARRTPPLWLVPGDRVEVEIGGIGLLETFVVDEQGR
jgi:2-keto-4-pentenoate hydratase/2-oxohepta-3-ene-1,7-dioic acid hydratase in catechol pathway